MLSGHTPSSRAPRIDCHPARGVVILTTSGHTVTMDHVTVAELKARLSHYLREVRTGRSFTVMSRDVPVATLGPYDPEIDELVVIEPTEDPASWGQIDLPPLKLSRDIQEYLDEARADRDFGPGHDEGP